MSKTKAPGMVLNGLYTCSVCPFKHLCCRINQEDAPATTLAACLIARTTCVLGNETSIGDLFAQENLKRRIAHARKGLKKYALNALDTASDNGEWEKAPQFYEAVYRYWACV